MTEQINILAIETSCDETSAAVVRDGRAVLSNVISSQIDTHRKFGGVVPEIASRKHMEVISFVVDEALETAGISAGEIDAVAVTSGPGLVGALLVGVAYAKALAFSIKKPIINVNHIEGHIAANYLEDSSFEPPFICLVVSGGHTYTVYVGDYGRYEILGKTRDDAAGEAFDKVARALGLSYPGGPALDKLSVCGDPYAIGFPRALLEEGNMDFSFSGLKSAVLNYLNKNAGSEICKADMAASFQMAVVDVLVKKTIQACIAKNIKSVALAGGVSCNSLLRRAMSEECEERGFSLKIPRAVYCTDNAAMIGACGYFNYAKGFRAGLDLNAYPGLPL